MRKIKINPNRPLKICRGSVILFDKLEFIRHYLSYTLKTLDITGFFVDYKLNCYVFSLVFALMSENKGNFLYLTANYLVQQSCGSTLCLPCGVSVDIHRGTDIRVT